MINKLTLPSRIPGRWALLDTMEVDHFDVEPTLVYVVLHRR